MFHDKNWVVAPPVTPKGRGGGQTQKFAMLIQKSISKDSRAEIVPLFVRLSVRRSVPNFFHISAPKELKI
jgi:hypothetical protein